MAGTRTIFLGIIIVVVILVGSAVGLLYLNPASPGRAKGSSTISTTFSATSGSPSNSPTTTTTFQSVSSSSSTSSSLPTANSSKVEPKYNLQLVDAGQQPVVSSNLTIPLPITRFAADGLGGDCGRDKCYTLNYTDGGPFMDGAGGL